MNPLVFVSFWEPTLDSIRSVVVPCGRPITTGNDISFLRTLAKERATALGWKCSDIVSWQRLEDEPGA